MNNERDSTLDIIKGLCMVTIVCSHFGHNILWFYYLYVYGFYFVSGYTFKDKTFKTFIKSKLHRLYFFFVSSCLFSLIVLKLLSITTNGVYTFDFNFKILLNIFLFNIPHNILSPAWFIFPLFIILMVYYVLNKIIKNKYIILGILFVVYCIAYYFKDYLSLYKWNNCTWLLNVCLGLFVFGCGQIVNVNSKLKDLLFNGRYSKDIFIISTIVIYIIYAYSNFEIDVRAGILNSFICNTIMCTVGMIFVFYLSKLISTSTNFAFIFSLIGRNRMAIMYFHLLSASIVTLFAHFCFGYEFPNNWSMSYNGGWLGVLNIIVGIFVPIICTAIFEKSTIRSIVFGPGGNDKVQ